MRSKSPFYSLSFNADQGHSIMLRQRGAYRSGLFASPCQAQHLEGILDRLALVVQLLRPGIAEPRADGGVAWPFEDCPELKVVAMAGGEDDAVEVCCLVDPGGDRLGQLAWPGILQGCGVHVQKSEAEGDADEMRIKNCDGPGVRHRAVVTGQFDWRRCTGVKPFPGHLTGCQGWVQHSMFVVLNDLVQLRGGSRPALRAGMPSCWSRRTRSGSFRAGRPTGRGTYRRWPIPGRSTPKDPGGTNTPYPGVSSSCCQLVLETTRQPAAANALPAARPGHALNDYLVEFAYRTVRSRVGGG
jgi:hypothetical protein